MHNLRKNTLLKNFVLPSVSIFSPSVPENCTIKDLLSSRNFENREGRSQSYPYLSARKRQAKPTLFSFTKNGFTFKVKDITLSQERRDKIQLFIIYLF
ncbi:unnamed protein product [Rhizophagus irregularis]|uniref:Uncharacterized protein n=1 Tax=Rhizophagus irregularis TaxID=588596 RepID=A0A915YQB0_9GLOM|nr:unnamed protein product [Rhizophagus irregularis]